jgi:elongation factor Ts
VKDVLAELSKSEGSEIVIKDFVRFTLGEGIEKEQSDFAAEVMAQAKGS